MLSGWDNTLLVAGIVVMLIALVFYFTSQSDRRSRDNTPRATQGHAKPTAKFPIAE